MRLVGGRSQRRPPTASRDPRADADDALDLDPQDEARRGIGHGAGR